MPKRISGKRAVPDENKKTAVYFDGYNLYYGRLRNSAYKWLDVVALFEGLLKVQDPGASLEMVKFFTAPALARFASHGTVSVEAQQSYHRALQVKYGNRFDLVCGAPTASTRTERCCRHLWMANRMTGNYAAGCGSSKKRKRT